MVLLIASAISTFWLWLYGIEHMLMDHSEETCHYFSFQPVLQAWFNKGCGMHYPVCGMMHIKEPLLLIGKSSPCGGSGFPLSVSEWSFTIRHITK